MHPAGFSASLCDDGEPITGGCLCGGVRFRLRSLPADVAHCHCVTCRRASGAPFVTWATLPRADVAITGGAPRPFRSSRHATRWFCPDCGSQLFLDDDSEMTVDIAAGSLDAPDRLVPRYNTYAHGRLRFLHGFDASLPDDPEDGIGTAPRRP